MKKMKKTVVKQGFSLVETMISLLVVSTILAASMSVITIRKNTGSDSLWSRAANHSDIYYGLGTSSQVGIGTNSPEAKLHIKGTNNETQLLIQADSSQSSANPLLKFVKSDGTTELARLYVSNFDLGIGLNILKNQNINFNGFNTAIGHQVLMNSGSGSRNTAMGYNALNKNTTGGNNVAVGTNALSKNTIGSHNTAIGFSTLFENISGGNNVAIGGYTLFNNTTGNSNTALGYNVLYKNTTGGYNTAIGERVLFNNTTGTSNTAVGTYALNANTTGSNNVAIGDSSLLTNKGYSNVAVGSEVLAQNSTGNGNTAIGDCALLVNNGSKNIAIGYYAGANDNNSSNKLYIANSQYSDANTSLVYGVFDDDGDGSITTSNQKVRINGNLEIAHNAYKPGGGSWDAISDIRLKDVIGSYTKGLKDILKINTVRYKYKKNNPYNYSGEEEHIGVVAQEIQKVFPEAVTKDQKGYYQVDKTPVDYALINAVKELKAENDELKQRLERLEKANGLSVKQEANIFVKFWNWLKELFF